MVTNALAVIFFTIKTQGTQRFQFVTSNLESVNHNFI